MRKVQEKKNWIWKVILLGILILLGVFAFGDFTPDVQVQEKDVTALLSN